MKQLAVLLAAAMAMSLGLAATAADPRVTVVQGVLEGGLAVGAVLLKRRDA